MEAAYNRREDEERRYALCTDVWRRVPAALRIPLLIEALARYRDRPVWKGVDRLHYQWLPVGVEASGEEVAVAPDEAQSLTILRRAHRYCGHGEDTFPPLGLALRRYRRKLYPEDFFDALRDYREGLADTRHTATQRLRAGEGCRTDRIRDGFAGLEGSNVPGGCGCSAALALGWCRMPLRRLAARIARGC